MTVYPWKTTPTDEKVRIIREAIDTGAVSSPEIAKVFDSISRDSIRVFCAKHGIVIPAASNKRLMSRSNKEPAAQAQPIYAHPTIMTAKPGQCREIIGVIGDDGFPCVCGRRVVTGRMKCRDHLGFDLRRTTPAHPEEPELEHVTPSDDDDPMPIWAWIELGVEHVPVPAVEVKRPSLADIARDVCKKHSITLSTLKSDRRDGEIVPIRHEFMYRASTEVAASLTRIGKFVRRDHTTVLHGIRKHAKKIAKLANRVEAAE